MKVIAALALATLLAHGQSAKAPTTLKDAYRGYFRIGAALTPAEFENRDPVSDPIITAQFNTISPENALKWESIHPRPQEFNFNLCRPLCCIRRTQPHVHRGPLPGVAQPGAKVGV